MIELNQFKNCHMGDDIYVLASGKSVDYIENSFFENKIVIGINQVYKKIHCQYLIRKEKQLAKEIIESNPNSFHFISVGSCGGKNRENYNYIKQIPNHNVILYSHPPNKIRSAPKSLPDDNSLVVSYSTITTGIHLAAYMGAKNIIIVGHDCGLLNGKCNFDGYHDNTTYKIAWKNGEKDYKKWVKSIENDTIQVKKLLKEKYDCNIYSLNPFINFGLEGNVYI